MDVEWTDPTAKTMHWIIRLSALPQFRFKFSLYWFEYHPLPPYVHLMSTRVMNEPRPSLFLLFSCYSSAFVCYTEHKPKSKKGGGRPGNEVSHTRGSIVQHLGPVFFWEFIDCSCIPSAASTMWVNVLMTKMEKPGELNKQKEAIKDVTLGHQRAQTVKCF